MDIALAISVGAILISGATVFYSMQRIKRIEARLMKLYNEFNRLYLENVVLMGAEDGKELFKENLLSLAKKLFKLVKKRYGLQNVTDYSELVDALREINLQPKLKASLIDFFSAITMLQYSNEQLSYTERKKLKQSAVELIKRLAPTPSRQVKGR